MIKFNPTYNTFQDEQYKIEFIVAFPRFLKPEEAQAIARRHFQQEKDAFFQIWKMEPANKDWNGDIDAKKEELFIQKRERFKGPIVLFEHPRTEALRAGSPPNV